MARARLSLVYVGVKSTVVAFDRKTGTEIWRTVLPAKYKSSSSFVNVARDSEGLFASCAGEVFALDPRNGALLWHDELKKLGTGLLTIATDLGGSSVAAVLANEQYQQEAAAASATTAAI